MTSKVSTIVLIALIICAARTSAQDCGDALDRAGKSYEEGNLREVIATLAPCVEGGMSSGDQWQAYRLLALAHLFLDEPQQADTAISRMLAINPRYQPNPARDPIEFIRPLQSFGAYPRVFAGLKAGINYTGREITRAFNVAGLRDFTVENKFTLGSDIGVMMDLNISPSIALSSEALYSSLNFSNTTTNLMTITRNYTERLTYLTLPLMMKYRIGDWSIEPYVYGGYYVQILLGASSDIEGVRSTTGADTVEIPDELKKPLVDNGLRATEDRRNVLGHGLMAGAGAVYKLGDGALVFDVRYQHGLAQVVKPDQRFSDPETLFKYFYIDDDFRLRDLSITIGYVFQLSFTTYRK